MPVLLSNWSEPERKIKFKATPTHIRPHPLTWLNPPASRKCNSVSGGLTMSIYLSHLHCLGCVERQPHPPSGAQRNWLPWRWMRDQTVWSSLVSEEEQLTTEQIPSGHHLYSSSHMTIMWHTAPLYLIQFGWTPTITYKQTICQRQTNKAHAYISSIYWLLPLCVIVRRQTAKEFGVGYRKEWIRYTGQTEQRA